MSECIKAQSKSIAIPNDILDKIPKESRLHTIITQSLEISEINPEIVEMIFQYIDTKNISKLMLSSSGKRESLIHAISYFGLKVPKALTFKLEIETMLRGYQESYKEQVLLDFLPKCIEISRLLLTDLTNKPSQSPDNSLYFKLKLQLYSITIDLKYKGNQATASADLPKNKDRSRETAFLYLEIILNVLWGLDFSTEELQDNSRWTADYDNNPLYSVTILPLKFPNVFK
ncbi:hypothetical protein HDV01_003229 [Terramyces sp. JEL0728]|nr:hypothetical protein HDV01_003229 [Terramyces sp. JEL0728]